MQRRVFASMAAVAAITAAITALSLRLVFGGAFSDNITENLRNVRVTFVNEAGDVTFDNKYDAAELPNHAERPEISQAFESGAGEYSRRSDTEGETTHYYARRLPEGNVLRLALTENGADTLLRGFVPSALFCVFVALAAAWIAARRLTWHIVQPMRNVSPETGGEPPYDELLPYVREIRRRGSEIAAEAAETERLNDEIAYITENMREGLLLTDAEGKALLINKRAADILNAGKGAGKHVEELCRDADFIGGVRGALGGAEGETRLKRGGRVYSVLFSHTPPAGALVLFIDVTDKLSAEKARREFTANVSHELKTPLTTIIGWAEMLAEGGVREEDVKPTAAKVRANASRLLTLVEDVIKLSEFDEGGAEANFTEFDFTEAVRAAAETCGGDAKRRGVTITVEGEPLSVRANRRMVEEIAYNLTDNAIRYNKEGGSVDIRVIRHGDLAVLTVKDTGIGIEDEHLPRVFERFYRADKSRSKASGGTGLGLSIVKHAAEFHGGWAGMSRNPEGGCTATCAISAGK